MKQLIQKHRDGDPITDSELDQLIDYYTDLCAMLEEQGERGIIFWSYFYYELASLKSYKRSREKRKP